MDTIYITAEDNARLRRLLLLSPYNDAGRRERELLRRELDRAAVLPRSVERPDAIRLGAVFEYADLPTGTISVGCLCLPADVAAVPHGISILSRFGAAVIGCCVGNEVWWAETDHCRRIRILRVGAVEMQEAEPDFPDHRRTPIEAAAEQRSTLSRHGAELAAVL